MRDPAREPARGEDTQALASEAVGTGTLSRGSWGVCEWKRELLNSKRRGILWGPCGRTGRWGVWDLSREIG